MAMLFALVALCLFGSALINSAYSDGGCPPVETQPDFDISQYLGNWYENRRFGESYDPNATCVVASYTSAPNDRILIVNSYISGFTEKPASIDAYLRIPDPSDAAKMKIRYPSAMPVGAESDYYVLGTDYESYSGVYSCYSVAGKSTQFAWILTRDQQPSYEVVAQGKALLARNGIDISQLDELDQTDC